MAEEDLIPLVPEKENCPNILAIKSESGIDVEHLLVKGLKNKEQNKSCTDMAKSVSKPKNLSSHSYSNKTEIISNNNTPLTIIDIDLKKENQNKNENFPYENKDTINKNIINNDKANDLCKKEIRDSIDSDFSLFDENSIFENFKKYFNTDF